MVSSENYETLKMILVRPYSSKGELGLMMIKLDPLKKQFPPIFGSLYQLSPISLGQWLYRFEQISFGYSNWTEASFSIIDHETSKHLSIDIVFQFLFLSFNLV